MSNIQLFNACCAAPWCAWLCVSGRPGCCCSVFDTIQRTNNKKSIQPFGRCSLQQYCVHASLRAIVFFSFVVVVVFCSLPFYCRFIFVCVCALDKFDLMEFVSGELLQAHSRTEWKVYLHNFEINLSVCWMGPPQQWERKTRPGKCIQEDAVPLTSSCTFVATKLISKTRNFVKFTFFSWRTNFSNNLLFNQLQFYYLERIAAIMRKYQTTGAFRYKSVLVERQYQLASPSQKRLLPANRFRVVDRCNYVRVMSKSKNMNAY